MKPVFSVLLFCIVCFSCTDEDNTGRIRRAPADGVYTDYQVWAEEGTDDVTVRLQFRRGHEEGEAFAVENPGKVLLDKEVLIPDSTRFMGVYYETLIPVDDFKGEHNIVYLDKSGKEHQEEFTFEPFSLVKELPANISKKPFSIQLQDFPVPATPIRLVMVDTSLHSAGVNEEVVIEDGRIQITEEHLRHLTKGPVTLEIYREEERPVKSNKTAYGKFTMSYGLRRYFNLVD